MRPRFTREEAAADAFLDWQAETDAVLAQLGQLRCIDPGQERCRRQLVTYLETGRAYQRAWQAYLEADMARARRGQRLPPAA